MREHRPYLLIVTADSRIWGILGDRGRDSRTSQRVGRRLAAQLVRLCCEQHRRYHLLEAPPAKYAWVFDAILAKMLKSAGGKFVLGDLCAYGCRGQRSRGPVRRRTGWLSNGELLLNTLGRRCACPSGTSQMRSQSVFRPACAACAARVKEIRCLDYATHMAYHEGKHASFAAGDVDEDGDAEMEAEYSDDTRTEEPRENEWGVRWRGPPGAHPPGPEATAFLAPVDDGTANGT